jgi:type I restriction enzyme, R subunit
VLESFSVSTVAALRKTISPLMQWRDCHGDEPALRFDLLIANLSKSQLLGSADAESLRDQIVDQVSNLPINLKQVQEKLPFIQKAKQTAFYKTATIGELENLRQELRGIMRYRKSGGTDRAKPIFINVAEDASDFESDIHHVKLAGMDFAAYRNRVQSVLDSLFDQSTALQKIRSGQPVADEDLKELISDVLLQDPDLRLEDLLEHYPNKSKNLALAIRRIVGMDAEKVDEQFKSFVQQYPALNANQIRFLELLKTHISTYGAIELDKLWDSPFTSLHSDGIDGVFSDSAQVDALLDLISNLNESAA